MRSRRGQLAKREKDVKAAQQEQADVETQLAVRDDEMTERNAALDAEKKVLERGHEELKQVIEETNDRLEGVSGMTRDEARRQLLSNLKAETRLSAAGMIKEIKDEATKNAEAESVKIMALTIERAASEFSSERTVSQFDLPKGSDLKGRIIGQEGKNIRAFEAATGIQLIVDEENNVVSLSGYNPVRREVARRVLETLVKDGNIHPRRIEDLTRRKRKRLDEEMKRAGQETVKELKLKNVHSDLIMLLGRLKYRSSYGQNVLSHSKEVAYLTGMLAAELRLDENLARRAGLMHDIGKAIDYEREGTHPRSVPRFAPSATSRRSDQCGGLSPRGLRGYLSDRRPGLRCRLALRCSPWSAA